MSSAAFFAFAALLIVAVSAQSEPSCDAVQPIQNADTSRLVGTWHAVNGHNRDHAFKCMKESTRVNAVGVIINDVEFTSTANNERITYTATGTPIDGQRTKLSFTNTLEPTNVEIANILDTDYEHYMVWETCKVVAGAPNRLILIMSRHTTLDQEYLQRATDAIRAKNINVSLTPIQAEC